MTLDTSIQDRLYASMVERDSGYASECWVWIGRLNRDGYAVFDVDRKPKRAVRVVYELIVGPIPDGLTLDHLCRNRACVRPLHVEPVTNRVNVLRGEGPTAVRARATECKRGHPLSGDNLRVDKRGYRSCRRCRTDWQIEADKRSGRRHRSTIARDYAAASPSPEPARRPWDHAYETDGTDDVCVTCGWTGSYAHTEAFYTKYHASPSPETE